MIPNAGKNAAQLVKMQDGAATLEGSLAVPNEAKHSLTI